MPNDTYDIYELIQFLYEELEKETQHNIPLDYFQKNVMEFDDDIIDLK